MSADMTVVTNNFISLQPVGCFVGGKDCIAIEDQRYA